MSEQIASLRTTIRTKYASAIADGALCVAFVWLAFDTESILWIIAQAGLALFFLYDAWRCFTDIERCRSEIKTAQAREEHRRMLGR